MSSPTSQMLAPVAPSCLPWHQRYPIELHSGHLSRRRRMIKHVWVLSTNARIHSTAVMQCYSYQVWQCKSTLRCSQSHHGSTLQTQRSNSQVNKSLSLEWKLNLILMPVVVSPCATKSASWEKGANVYPSPSPYVIWVPFQNAFSYLTS